MITLYKYEDKNKEILVNKCVEELNVSIEDIYTKETELETGLFKNKKYLLTAIKKEDIIKEIKEYINELSRKMNLEIHSEIKEKDGNINVMLVSDKNAILIGKDGRTLESIQLLINQLVKAQTDFNLRIIVDASNYKGKKIKNFEYEIKKMAKDVLRTKIELKLDPMNSYNRRIVHSVVSEFPNLTTRSEGEEPNRYTIISYKED